MIRRFEHNDLEQVMDIWLNENIKAHSFIAKEYWMKNYEFVKSILPEAKYMFILKAIKYSDLSV